MAGPEGAVQPFGPSLVYPSWQSPHFAEPALLVHVRLLWQPPLSLAHGFAGRSLHSPPSQEQTCPLYAFAHSFKPRFLHLQSRICSASAWSVAFLFLQQVLKWLQNPLLKNVMLLHFASSSQDFLHAARLPCLPDDPLRNVSPLDASHSWLLKKLSFKFFATPL
jgi:hypothetical protein